MASQADGVSRRLIPRALGLRLPERAHADAGVRGDANPIADAHADRCACRHANANGAAYSNAYAPAYSYCRGISYTNTHACANAHRDCDA